MKLNKYMIMFVIGAFLFNQLAYAGRLGGGRSRGMQRSMPSYQSNRNYSNNNYSGYNRNNQTPLSRQNNQINEQPQRKWMSAGNAALLGAAAGVAGGYLLGKSNGGDNQNVQNNQNNPNTVTNTLESINQNNVQNAPIDISNDSNKNLINTSTSQIPWGIIFILFIILLIGIAFFRKKSTTPNIYRDKDYEFSTNHNDITNHHGSNTYQQSSSAIPSSNNSHSFERLADGSEKEFFLRQAKGMFLHIQSMNNKDNVFEIAKYFTPELYESIKDEIASNQSIADFTNLECQLVDSVIENNTLIASVKFSGMVSDNPNQPSEPFVETWHFVKQDINANKWLVAGIQQ